MAQRVAIAGFYHETNTFSTKPTSLQDFKDYQFAAGEALIERYRETSTELAGMIRGAEEAGIALVPLQFAAAVPSGTITRACFDALCESLAEMLSEADPAGLLLVLHGAAVADGVDDADGQLLARLRGLLGDKRPIVATTDFHANISERMIASADVIIGYDSFPHVDMFDRGREAVTRLMDLLKGGSIAKAFRSLPLLTVPQRQCSSELPVAGIMARLHALESEGSILCGSVALGFPYADSSDIGASVFCYARQASEAEAAAKEVARLIWSHRDDFDPQLTDLRDLASVLDGAGGGPIILVDPADNIGGGSAGDGTAVLSTLLAEGLSGAVMVINDPDAARAAGALGVGGRYSGWLGAKADKAHGSPVHVDGEVLFCGEVSYSHSGSYMTGMVTQMGSCALLEAGGNKILVTSLRTMPFDIEQLRAVGIEPAEQRLIVVKSATAWRAAYEPIAAKAVYLDTPGICPSNLHRLPYSKRRRPVYPLETDVAF